MAKLAKKQTTNGTGIQPVITYASDPLPTRNIHVVIHGKPGMGKTSLGFTFPKPLIVDANSGIDRAYAPLRKDAIQLGKKFSFGQFSAWVMSDNFQTHIEQHGYKTLVFDTIGSLLDDHIAPYLITQEPAYGTSVGLSRSGWGALSGTFGKIKARCWNLGLNIVSICHSKEDGEGRQRQWELDIKGGSKGAVYESADQIGFLFFEGEHRTIGFEVGGQYIAKNTAGIANITVPDASDPNYAGIGGDIIEAVQDALVQASTAQIEIKDQVEEWRADLEAADKPASFDALIATIAEMKMGGLKVAVKKILGEQLKAKAYFYNKETGKVEEKSKNSLKDTTVAELYQEVGKEQEAKEEPKPVKTEKA